MCTALIVAASCSVHITELFPFRSFLVAGLHEFRGIDFVALNILVYDVNVVCAISSSRVTPRTSKILFIIFFWSNYSHLLFASFCTLPLLLCVVATFYSFIVYLLGFVFVNVCIICAVCLGSIPFLPRLFAFILFNRRLGGIATMIRNQYRDKNEKRRTEKKYTQMCSLTFTTFNILVTEAIKFEREKNIIRI